MEWTPEQMADFRRELNAIDSLLQNLMPEDDLARLAIDPKRQTAAAQMVGTVILARDLLAKTFKRLDTPPNGKAKWAIDAKGMAHRTSVGWIMNHLPTTRVRKSEYVQRAVKAGYNRSAVYFAINKLLKDGSLKQTEGSTPMGEQKRELYT